MASFLIENNPITKVQDRVTFFGDEPREEIKDVKANGETVFQRRGIESGSRSGIETVDGIFTNSLGQSGRVVGEEYDRDTGETHTIVAVPSEGGHGRFETHEVTWQRSGEKQMVISRTRRLFS